MIKEEEKMFNFGRYMIRKERLVALLFFAMIFLVMGAVGADGVDFLVTGGSLWLAGGIFFRPRDKSTMSQIVFVLVWPFLFLASLAYQ